MISRRYAALLSVVVTLMLVAGAALGGGKRGGGRELEFWHSMSIYQGNALEELIKEYNALQDDVVVRPVFQGLYGEMRTKLAHALANKSTPDIAQVGIEYLDTFIHSGKLSPITGFIPEEDSKDILPQFWSAVTREQEVYAYPFNMSVQVLYYNRDAFRHAGLDPSRPPRTWDEVIQYGKRLTVDLSGNGLIDQWGVMVSLEGVFGFTPLIRQMGGELLNDSATSAVFDSEAGVSVMRTLHDMIYRHRIMPPNWTLFEGTSAFLEGKIVMGPITSAGIKFAEENLPWELGIAPLPYFENKSALLGGAGLINMNRSAARTREAVAFMSWLTGRRNTVTWHQKTGYLPVRSSAIESLEIKSFHAAHPNYRVPVEQLPYARPPDFTPHLSQINAIVRYAIEEILIDSEDPEPTLEAAAHQVNLLLEEEGSR
jgi:sn-glycerol 3-phosphate transport system substrate-binding protein